MKNNCLLLFLLVSISGLAQNRIALKGKIIVNDAKPSEVHIINLNSEQEVISDANGDFTISVAADDLLVFSSSHLDYFRKIVEQDDLDKKLLSVAMTSKSTMLDEVEIVSYNNINAVSLGILSKPAKKYTVAERRLYGATSSPLDGLLNTLSGRKEMLKDAVEVEKKEMALKAIDGLFPESFYTQTLKIPKEEINGFYYYCVEDFKFSEALKGTNSFLVQFLMIKLALDYKAIRDAK